MKEPKEPEFEVGTKVYVKQRRRCPPSMWRRPFLPVPGKLEDLRGTVVQQLGIKTDPEFFSFCRDLGLTEQDAAEPCEACYLVEFLPEGAEKDLKGATRKPESECTETETIQIEVFHSWLQIQPEATLLQPF